MILDETHTTRARAHETKHLQIDIMMKFTRYNERPNQNICDKEREREEVAGRTSSFLQDENLRREI